MISSSSPRRKFYGVGISFWIYNIHFLHFLFSQVRAPETHTPVNICRSSHSHFVHFTVCYPHFIHIFKHFPFTHHSQKSIFTHQKSIYPLFSFPIGCYNTLTLRAAASGSCKKKASKIQLRFIRPTTQGGIAVNKISPKQLLINAMEEYGNNLILSDRFWSWQPSP